MICRMEDKLQENDLTTEELIERVEVDYMNYCDVPQIAKLMTMGFGVSTECFAIEQLVRTRAMMEHSVKVYDKKTNEIYGFLILSNHNLNDGSPIRFVEPTMAEFMSAFTQVHGYAFVLDKRLRNKGYDRKMISLVSKFIQLFDFTWLAVDGDLRSGPYWKRLGFRELFTIPEATFYAKFSENVENADIYYETIFFNSEDHSNKRETRKDSDEADA